MNEKPGARLRATQLAHILFILTRQQAASQSKEVFTIYGTILYISESEEGNSRKHQLLSKDKKEIV